MLAKRKNIRKKITHTQKKIKNEEKPYAQTKKKNERNQCNNFRDATDGRTGGRWTDGQITIS